MSALAVAAVAALVATSSAAPATAAAHPEIPEDVAFHAWVTESGIPEERAPAKGFEPPFVRGEKKVEAACSAVKDVLFDFEHYESYFAGVVRKAAVLSHDDATARIHYVWAYPWPLRDRDSLVGYTLATDSAGGWTLAWRDDARAGDPTTGVRIGHVEGRTSMQPLAGGARCRVTYTFYGDLGIHFPEGLTNKILRTEPVKYFEAIDKGLAAKRGASAPASPEPTPIPSRPPLTR